MIPHDFAAQAALHASEGTALSPFTTPTNRKPELLQLQRYSNRREYESA
jgi:hypothetical protein